jgi:hypothetical protein
MRVHVNGELFADAVGVLPDRWNGWVVPVFSPEESLRIAVACSELGWVVDDEDGFGFWTSDGSGVVFDGWCWEVCEA